VQSGPDCLSTHTGLNDRSFLYQNPGFENLVLTVRGRVYAPLGLEEEMTYIPNDVSPPYPPTLILDVCLKIETRVFNRESKVVHKPFRRPKVQNQCNPPILKSGGRGGNDNPGIGLLRAARAKWCINPSAYSSPGVC